MISVIKRHTQGKKYKYSIQIPCSVGEALELDKINNDDLWYQAIQKEMTNLTIAFKVLEDTQEILPGY